MIIVVSFMDYFDKWNKYSIFYGISYLPPIWLLIPVTISAVLFYFLQKKIIAMITAVIYILYFLVMGDYSFNFLSYNQEIDSESKPLSVLALNVQYYSKSEKRVFDYIDSMDADIVLLSENTLAKENINTFNNISRKYHLCIGKKDETAIFSKYPIIFCKQVDLPTSQASLSGSNIIEKLESNPNRSFSHIKINYFGIEVNIISIRFIAGRPKSKSLRDQVAWGNYLARKQAEEIHFFMSYLKKLDGPIIFGGDLNAPPNAKIINDLSKIANDAAYLNSFIPLPTFRTKFPVMRLDYIFATREIKVVDYSRPKIEVSDHFPVFAKFRIYQQ